MQDNHGWEVFERLQSARETLLAEKKVRYEEESRGRLKENIEKKIRTTMIGSLQEVEDAFGWLWGQGRQWRHLSDREREMADVYADLRLRILDLGNKQLRAASAEIDRYSVSWNRYEYNLDVYPQNRNGSTQ